MNRRTDHTNPERMDSEVEMDQALRPLTFADFNGQKKIVDNLRVFITAARQRESRSITSC